MPWGKRAAGSSRQALPIVGPAILGFLAYKILPGLWGVVLTAHHPRVQNYLSWAKELISIYTNNNNPGEYLYNLIIQSEYYNEFEFLNPWIINFKEYDVNSIDPIHIFASFNSWKITNDTRTKKLNLYYKILTKRNFKELEKYDLDIFKYFPHVQITRVVGARSNKEQKRV